jgi:hypothetical protein
LTTFDDGSGPALYAGGAFTWTGSVNSNYVARWDGIQWSGLGSGTNHWVRSLTVHDDGSGPALYAGGFFTTVNGHPISHIAKWDGSSWSPLGDGTIGAQEHVVNALHGFEDGGERSLFAGGDFTDMSATGDSFLARWSCPPVDTSTPFCFGDGIDADVTTDCPCSNFGEPGHGCGNSVNTGGALLRALGTTSPDAVDLTISGMPPGVSSIFLQGDAIKSAGVVFGDGVRCAAGSLLRLGLRNDTDNDGSTMLGPGAGDAQISTLGSTTPGSTYAYQTYYRNPNPAWCPPATFNVSNGVRITW